MYASRVLVCGGRDFGRRDYVANALLELEAKTGPWSVLIQGYGGDVDSEAEIYATGRFYMKGLGFRADWHKYGKAAGPIRNQRMIDEGRPDLVIAFPGGRGTADMVRRALLAGVRVIEVAE